MRTGKSVLTDRTEMLEVAMQHFRTVGLIGIFVFLGGCASHSTTNDEQVDLYLSTLDDKHFVWCELDLEQCRDEFEKWKLTPRGRMSLREFEQENTGQTYNTHHLPNVFRTHFVDERQFEKEMGGKQGNGQDVSQDSEGDVRSPGFLRNGTTKQEEMSAAPEIYGPEFAP